LSRDTYAMREQGGIPKRIGGMPVLMPHFHTVGWQLEPRNRLDGRGLGKVTTCIVPSAKLPKISL